MSFQLISLRFPLEDDFFSLTIPRNCLNSFLGELVNTSSSSAVPTSMNTIESSSSTVDIPIRVSSKSVPQLLGELMLIFYGNCSENEKYSNVNRVLVAIMQSHVLSLNNKDYIPKIYDVAEVLSISDFLGCVELTECLSDWLLDQIVGSSPEELDAWFGGNHGGISIDSFMKKRAALVVDIYKNGYL
eukprot:Tbor_TRINITY_DN5286_c0_g4::TRINITY_DN5286_c0_g4_i1::g.16860::m.16860